MNKSKVAIVVSKTVSVVQMIIGVVCLLFFGIVTIGMMADNTMDAGTKGISIVICLAFDALGIWLIVLSIRKNRLIKEFKKYVGAVSNNTDGFIPDIAMSLGTSENIVKRNLELMIKKKFFVNAYIDKNTNCIKIINRQNANVNAVQHNNSNQQPSIPSTVSQAVEMVTVKCSGCGGINTIQKGAVGECDYCGSAIKGE